MSSAAQERAAAGPRSPEPRTPRALWIGCAMALGACAFWALRPLGEPEAPSAALAVETDGRVAAAPPPPLDLAAFNAPLWVAAPEPPPPAAPPPPPPPPAPVRIQLLAIVRGDDGPRAALYDPDSDTLATLGAGGTIGRCTVEEVTASSVRLKDGENTHTLSLEEPGAGGRR